MKIIKAVQPIQLFQKTMIPIIVVHVLILSVGFVFLEYFSQQWVNLNKPLGVFSSLLLGSSLLGTIHIWVVTTRYREWLASRSKVFWFSIIMSLLPVGIIIFKYSHTNLYNLIGLLGAISFFLLPMFILFGVYSKQEIPEKIFKGWKTGEVEDELAIEIAFPENSKGLHWHFMPELEGQLGNLPDEELRLYQPFDLKEHTLGTMFQASLLYYNTIKNPEHPIALKYIDDEGKLKNYQWLFYSKTFWGRRYLDPSKKFDDLKLPQIRWRGKSNNGQLLDRIILKINVIRFK